MLLEPRVVPLRSLVVSHDAEGRANPAYPHKEGIQPRDRSAAPSQAQINDIIARFAPERLLPNVEAGAGTPIVNPHDLVVETGNGRVMALMRIFREPELAAKRQAYLDTLARAGFDTTGIDEPVLVSARLTELTPAERIAFVRDANGRVQAAESAVELARRDADAAREILHLWRGGEINDAANDAFRREFLARVPVQDLPNLVDAQGVVLPQLAVRIERALLQAAYGDALGPVLDRMLVDRTEGIKALTTALRNVAGDWAALRAEIAAGRVAADQEATPALAEAVNAILEARARKLKVADLIAQIDIERPPPTPAGIAMLQAMYPDGDLNRNIKAAPRLTATLQGFLDRARAQMAGPNLFGLPPPSVADTLTAATRADAATGPAEEVVEPAAQRALPEGGQAGRRVAEPAPPDLDPQAARLLEAEGEAAALAAAREADEAAWLEAQRLAAADLRLMVPDATGERAAASEADCAQAAHAPDAGAARRQRCGAAAAVVGLEPRRRDSRRRARSKRRDRRAAGGRRPAELGGTGTRRRTGAPPPALTPAPPAHTLP